MEDEAQQAKPTPAMAGAIPGRQVLELNELLTTTPRPGELGALRVVTINGNTWPRAGRTQAVAEAGGSPKGHLCPREQVNVGPGGPVGASMEQRGNVPLGSWPPSPPGRSRAGRVGRCRRPCLADARVQAGQRHPAAWAAPADLEASHIQPDV
eukprot:6982518-Pyramimonas_sp.AAC.1